MGHTFPARSFVEEIKDIDRSAPSHLFPSRPSVHSLRARLVSLKLFRNAANAPLIGAVICLKEARTGLTKPSGI